MGMLTAAMLVLGYIEYILPITTAIPGVKLGLSNTVLIYGVYAFTPQIVLLLMLVKTLISGLLFGGVSAMMYALAGGLLSVGGMLLLRKLPGIGVVGVSVVGAVLHNIGQVILAMWIFQTNKLLYYMAVLILAAVIMGCTTGIVANRVFYLLHISTTNKRMETKNEGKRSKAGRV